ncbi:hypothetical protein [Streptomyces atratus]|uniref:hypothetical protein n=1 Tax=Streptomyces atratus TaxID=1893 RepID=UPI0033DF41CE
MRTSLMGCEGATTLFHEPDGLLLRSCLIPKDRQHREHLLTFQLGYLGPGEITVHVGLEGGSSRGGRIVGSLGVSTVVLNGVEAAEEFPERSRQRIPSVQLTYVTLLDRYVVWGQAGSSDDDLCGEISTVVSGSAPMLATTTRVGATRKAISDADPLVEDSCGVPQSQGFYCEVNPVVCP